MSEAFWWMAACIALLWLRGALQSVRLDRLQKWQETAEGRFAAIVGYISQGEETECESD